MFKKVLLCLMLFILSMGIASACDNATDIVLDDNADSIGVSQVVNEDIQIPENDEQICEDDDGDNLSREDDDWICENVSDEAQNPQIEENDISNQGTVQKSKVKTKVTANNPSFYYTQKGQLIGYLKDNDNHAVKNKKVSILLNGKTFMRTTDSSGKFVLKLKLVPNSYNVKIRFMGDSGYYASQYDAMIKVNKLPVSLKTDNYNTYWKSDLFFKAKVTDKLKNKPVSGVKVLFKVYHKNSLCLNHYSTTDRNGIARLNKNFAVGDYEILTYLSSKKLYSFSSLYSKSTLKIKPTAEVACCSFYAQISNDESLSGFRRDSTYGVNVYIQSVKWFGRSAVKQYKTIGSYSFHTIVTSDGWCIGTGGADNADVNRAIENLAGQMVQSNSISLDKIGTIMGYIRSLGIGHFAIKSPYGYYVAAWGNNYEQGKLNPGEYISVPNNPSFFRHGRYSSFGNDPAQIGVKIAATDGFGANRRDITVYHWKAITNRGSTEAHIAVHGANDNGYLVGRSTAYLKDNIFFDGKFFNGDSLPQSTGSMYLGYFNLGKIDYMKVKTTISAPVVNAYPKQFKEFKVRILNKNNNRPIGGIWIKLDIYTGNSFKTYSLKTDSNGVAKYSFKFYEKGYHRIYIYSANRNYYISKYSGFRVNAIKTAVSAPIVDAYVGKFKQFKVKILDKTTKKPIKGVWIKLRLYSGNSFKTYSLKTDSNGVAKYSFKFYEKGYHRIYIYSANKNYDISKYSGFRVNYIKTAVSAPVVKAYQNRSKEFKVTVLNKVSKKPVAGVGIKVDVYTGNTFKTYSLKTDSNGVAKISLKFSEKGYHKIHISSANRSYVISKYSGFGVI